MINIYYYIDKHNNQVTLKSTNKNRIDYSDIGFLTKMSSFVIEENTADNTIKLIKNRYAYSTVKFNSIDVFTKYSKFCNNILNKEYLDVSIMFSFDSFQSQQEFINKYILKV